MTAGEDNVDKLCAAAQNHLKLYQQHLPKPGMLHFPNTIGSQIKGMSSNLLNSIGNHNCNSESVLKIISLS